MNKTLVNWPRLITSVLITVALAPTVTLAQKVDFCGLYRGLVTNSADPESHGRVQVMVSKVDPHAHPWALPSVPIDRQFVPPATGKEVWIAYEGCDRAYPVWIGGVRATCAHTSSGQQVCEQN